MHITTPIPNPLEIVCVDCTQLMRVEKQIIDTYHDDVLLAVACACGRRLGALNLLRLRHTLNQRVSTNLLQALECDVMGERGKELREHARELMQRAEDYISMATWARDGKPA